MPSKGRTGATPSRRGYSFHRETDLTRRVEIREEHRTVLIVTNGQRTKIDYFTALKTEPWVTAGRVIVKFGADAPEAVVLRTASIRNDNDFDEGWVVCDVDEFDVAPAIKSAAGSQVNLALSVPCFEVWLILHKTEGCPGFNGASQAARHLKSVLAHWNKSELNFDDFRDGVLDAIIRAKRLGDPPDANPSSAVWRLAESLRTPSDAPTAGR